MFVWWLFQNDLKFGWHLQAKQNMKITIGTSKVHLLHNFRIGGCIIMFWHTNNINLSVVYPLDPASLYTVCTISINYPGYIQLYPPYLVKSPWIPELWNLNPTLWLWENTPFVDHVQTGKPMGFPHRFACWTHGTNLHVLGLQITIDHHKLQIAKKNAKKNTHTHHKSHSKSPWIPPRSPPTCPWHMVTPDFTCISVSSLVAPKEAPMVSCGTPFSSLPRS